MRLDFRTQTNLQPTVIDKWYVHVKSHADGIYDQFATTLGLDLGKFKTDMADAAIEQMVNADVQEGRAAGVRGTPTFFINGRRYQERDRSVDAIKKVINEQILKK